MMTLKKQETLLEKKKKTNNLNTAIHDSGQKLFQKPGNTLRTKMV